jgi:hypothetical protein
MSALLQLRNVIDASLDDDNYMTSDPACMAKRMLEEARKIGRMALEMAGEIANDPTISAAEAARQSALLSEETHNAATRLQTRLSIVRSLPFVA